MDILSFIKNNFTEMPYSIGSLLSFIPYDLRPGISKVYRKRKVEIKEIDNKEISAKKKYIFDRVKNIAVFAYNKIPFYSNCYCSAGIDPSKFNYFEELEMLPIIRKSDLQNIPLQDRSFLKTNRSLVNTGGSTGQPLEFYIEPSSVGHEWAHMHHIWSQFGYKQSDIKIVAGGRSNIKNIIQYDAIRNNIVIDIYSGWEAIAEKLVKQYQKYKPCYLHGYPSAIFDFIIWLKENDHPLLGELQDSIKGMFLGSELPAPVQRLQVEKILDCKSISWYGHTERSVLAYEREIYGEYWPFVTYGFAEASLHKKNYRLIATNYYNYVSPLIRYDTGDLITPRYNSGLLTSFTIAGGRESEFILDRNGNKIFLTALIFGRHHEIFNQSKYIQIRQRAKGTAEVLIVPRENIDIQTVTEMFDSSNVLIDFTFSTIEKPFRTKIGKVPLLVK
ncbi:MAG: hypothetical protein D3925_00885 [Candidatus Electrothrix sp. AR5]|nr:hypothetical protein [Candidatus Electrothrix sp. AR5]